jgi:2-polyprenyl-3-methyl-5-hydroxy-6-metoxy-1,4-benzoquinol methylase
MIYFPGYPIGWQMTGVDYSEEAIKEAGEYLGDLEGVHLIKDNAETFRTDHTFDYVICTEVLEHVENPEKVLQTIFELAKPGATIIISVPNEFLTNLIKRLSFGLFGKPLDDWHKTKFSLDKLLSMAKPYFEPKHVKRIPFRLLPLTYVIKFEKPSGRIKR